jgi:hypothetical protein
MTRSAGPIEAGFQSHPVSLGGTPMNDTDRPGESSPGTDDQEPIPMMQRLLDNPFLLLLLGILVPAVFYIIWGVMEITQIPIAN